MQEMNGHPLLFCVPMLLTRLNPCVPILATTHIETVYRAED